jgi:hypothetical protein
MNVRMTKAWRIMRKVNVSSCKTHAYRQNTDTLAMLRHAPRTARRRLGPHAGYVRQQEHWFPGYFHSVG